jgi:peptidoglycan-N-acetylglucosamine deacetylase
MRVASPILGLVLMAVSMLPSPSVAGTPEAGVAQHGERVDPVVALTFDDGWDGPRCARIAAILRRYGVAATWFPNALYVARDRGVWRAIARSYPIANHTTHHRFLRQASLQDIWEEIARDERIVEQVTGLPMLKLLRPPYGAFDGRVRRVAAGLGYRTIALWDIDSGDSAGLPAPAVVRRATAGAPGSIVLMHCGPAVTPRVLPAIIKRYRARGFGFVTLATLLGATTEDPADPMPRPRAAGPDHDPAASPDPEAIAGSDVLAIERLLLEVASAILCRFALR